MSFAFTASSLTRRAMVTLTMGVAATMSSACDDSTSPNKPRMVYGESQALGAGIVRTYVALSEAGKPLSVGVAFNDAALTNLPMTPNHPSPSALMLQLDMPASAPVTGYDHVMLDWNPAGHEPDHVYTHPHFDFHFFSISRQQVMNIMPTDSAWATKSAAFPAAEFVPAGYQAASTLAGIPPVAASVPMMGVHWLDTSSPELQPPPAGKTFTETFIYGSYDGNFIFIEPMITKAYIESIRNTAGMSRSVGVPTAVASPGYYPSSYSIRYDAAAKEYRIALDNLTYRQ